MARILILCSTVDGHTREICRRIAGRLQDAGHQPEIRELVPGLRVDSEDCDGILIGASIRYGHHRPCVKAFIESHFDLLTALPSAFFSVNVVARKPAKRSPATNTYVRKFVASIRWQPRLVGIFAGRIDYPRYGFFDRNMIRLIMWMTGGPTDPRSSTEFTDWQQVEAFADAVAELIPPVPASSPGTARG